MYYAFRQLIIQQLEGYLVLLYQDYHRYTYLKTVGMTMMFINGDGTVKEVTRVKT